jgi:PKD repeat protein
MFCVQYRESDFNFSLYLVTPGPDDNLPQPPVVFAGDDATIVEGQTFDQSGVFTAGGGAWTVAVDYGDGSGEQPLMFNADKTFSLNHRYTDDGTYTVTVKVTDDRGLVGTDTLTVTATNALPHIGGAVILPYIERQNATLQVAIDPTNPNDELTLTIDWGDGTAPQMFACPSDPSVLSFQHRYAHDGVFTVKLSLADDDGSVDTSNVQANVQNVDIIVVGSDTGSPQHVKVFDSNTHKVKFDLTPYESKFRGGVRVAVGDLNGDGIPDIITAPGMGRASNIKAFDGTNGHLLQSFIAFPGFMGGVSVAAGDVNGDGHADIIVGRGMGQSQVRVFSGGNGSLLSSFFAYPGFGGGVNVAAGDVNGDGRAEIITAPAGGTGGSHVKVFDGVTGGLRNSFIAYPGFQGGCFVAAGDVNGDGKDDIITGPSSGVPQVKVFDAATLQAVDSFFAYAPNFAGGVRVAVGDVNGDGIPDIITGAGKGAAQKVRLFDGVSLAALDSFFALDPRTSKGLFVAGSR